jgi:hypothetical protein
MSLNLTVVCNILHCFGRCVFVCAYDTGPVIETSFKGAYRILTLRRLKTKKDLIFGTVWYKNIQDVGQCPEHCWSFLKYTVVSMFQSYIIYLCVVYFTTLSVTHCRTAWSDWVIEGNDFQMMYMEAVPWREWKKPREMWVGLVAAFDEIRTGNSRLRSHQSHTVWS